VATEEDGAAQLSQFALKAQMRGCKVSADSAETKDGTMRGVVAQCESGAVMRLALQTAMMTACARDVPEAQCDGLAKEIDGMGQVYEVARWQNKASMFTDFEREIGKVCRIMHSEHALVMALCPQLGVLALAGDGDAAVLACSPVGSSECVEKVRSALQEQ
jgi:hypothetical protein